MGLEAASELGTRHDSLTALRRILARAIDDCESKRDLSSLSARFTDVCAQIEAIEANMDSEGVDPVTLALARVVDIR